MRVVVVPAPIVASGHGVPTVCCRHGEAATSHHDLTFRSRVPGWLAVLLLVIGLALVLLIAVLIQRKVRTPAWPFCARCEQSLTRRRIVLGAIFTAALLCAAVSVAGWAVAADGRPGGFAAGLVLSVVLALVGGRVFTLATRSRVANGYVAENGMTVEFRNPHPDFLAQVVKAKEEFQRYAYAAAGPAPMVAPPPF